MKIKLTLFIWIFCQTVFAQNNERFYFQNLTVDNGLSQNSVISIAQDTTGFLWFATQDGLNKYDGKNYEYYYEQFEDITRDTYSHLGKVYCDREGYIWIIALSGRLKKLDPVSNAFEAITSFEDVNTIFQDVGKNSYVATRNNGLFKIDYEKRDTVQLFKETDKKTVIYDFMEVGDRLWAATNVGIADIGARSYSFHTAPPANTFSCLTKSADDRWIFAGTFGTGLFQYNTTSFQWEPFVKLDNDVLPNDLNIEDIHFDSKNRLWIATYGSGLYLADFAANTIKRFLYKKHDPYSISYEDLLTIFEDHTGTIWIGTDGGGVNYYDEYLHKFNVLTNSQVPENIAVDVIRAISKADDGTLWLGTSGKGLTKIDLDRDEYHTYTFQNLEIASNRILSLLHSKDTLWIGTQDQGLSIFTNGRFKNFNHVTDISFQESAVWPVFKDSGDRLWLSTKYHGLAQFDPSHGIVASFGTDQYHNRIGNIRAIAEGRNQTLWLGTDDTGLYSYGPGSDRLEKITGIFDNIKSLYYQSDTDILWIGTNGSGLKRYDPATGEITVYDREQNLSNNVVYGILPDADNNLWLSTNNGISKFTVENGQAHIENYGKYSGLQSHEFNTGAYYKGDDGILYFGGLEGLNWFRPEELSVNPYRPKTIITQVRVFGTPRSLSEKIPLNHTQNTITFTFSSLQFSRPNLNQYKYRLSGNDEDWTLSGNHNEARYTNLGPGKYRFQVLSSSYDGVWGDVPAAYDFEIEQPWHFTNTAVALFTTFVFQGCFIAIGIFMLLLYARSGKTDYLLYGTYIWLFATYFFLRIDLELQTGLFFTDNDVIYYFLAPLIFLITGIFVRFIDSFAEIRKYHPGFSKEINGFAVIVYVLAVVAVLYLLANKNFTLVKDHLNLVLLPMHLYAMYAVARAFIVVRSPLRYYILLGNIFLIGFTMVGVYYGSKIAFSAGADANNVFGFYSVNISQMGVFLEMLIFSLGLGHKFHLVAIEKDKIQRNDELKTKLYTDISHEIRTPLTLISGPVENQLNRTGLTEKDRKELNLIKHNADRLLELTNQMTDLSMIDSGQKKLHLSKGNLNTLMLQLIEAYQYRANRKKITLQSAIQGLHDCWFDRDVINKIVSNLLSNAIKYASANSSIQTDIKEKDGFMILTVVNKTEHLDRTDLHRLFQRFYQNDEVSDGMGVGLALVKELVVLSEGTITANIIEGAMIQFTVSLPVEISFFDGNTVGTGERDDGIKSLPRQVAVREANTRTVPAPPPMAKFSGPEDHIKLLVVEDNVDMRTFIVSNFGEGYRVLEAENGKKGVAMAREFLPDLIISDVMMPVKNGFELCDSIKQDPLTSHIPVILLTAKVGEENEIEGFKTGADVYMTKPFGIEKLQVRVQQLIETRKRLAEHYKTTFSIDPELAITDTEAAFLRQLKTVLEAHITDPDFSTETFSRSMHMSRRQLHRKLGAIIGMTPTEFVRNERLRLAADLLKRSDATVAEIAYQVGFGTPSYFIKCFKKIYGHTPNEY